MKVKNLLLLILLGVFTITVKAQIEIVPREFVDEAIRSGALPVEMVVDATSIEPFQSQKKSNEVIHCGKFQCWFSSFLQSTWGKIFPQQQPKSEYQLQPQDIHGGMIGFH